MAAGHLVDPAQGTPVRSARGALPVFPPVGFPEPPPEPGVPVTRHRALHKPPSWLVWSLIPWPATDLGLLFPGIGSALC